MKFFHKMASARRSLSYIHHLRIWDEGDILTFQLTWRTIFDLFSMMTGL